LEAEQSTTGRLSFDIASPRNGTDAIVQAGPDSARYFYLTDHHQMSEGRRKSPDKILLLWDASHSGNLRDIKKEISLLNSYFQTCARTVVDLKILRDDLASGGSFSVAGGSWGKLKTTLENLRYDGATRLDRLDLRGPGYEEVIYVGDGLSTLGSGKCRWGNRPIFVVNSSPVADHLLLSQLAQKTEGSYLDLTRLSQEEALRGLTHEKTSLLGVTGSGVHDLILETEHGISTVKGRISKESTTLKLRYGRGGRTRFTREVKIGQRDSNFPGRIASKLWAQGRVDELSMASKANKSEIIALAKKHHLVTDETSLIVLDRLEDYLTHGIVPPEAAMKKNYFAKLRDREVSDGTKAADLDEIYESWQGLVAWHQGRKQETGDGSDLVLPSGGDAGGGADGGAGSPLFFGGGTAGNRSGDFAITRNSIDAILNNPGRSPSSSVRIKKWEPDTPYLQAYKTAIKSGRSLLPLYYQWKEKYQISPGFYLESAGFFAQQKEVRLARRILSNLAELSAESPEMLRILAYRYSQIGEDVLAEMLFREVAEMRAEEPQSYRDLALALIQLKRYREAEKLLWKVISSEWDGRFEGIQMIALNEWNHLFERHGSGLSSRSIQKRFRYRLDSDIRVLISWDTDNSDMDLWVTDPSEEKCYYANSRTKSGGRISNDFTDGRGPEEFMIKKAPSGIFKIQADYFGTRQQTAIGPTTLHATVITNWGRRNEKREHLTFRLGEAKEVVEVGEVTFSK
jgi:tetratricopeptide (TPR) repeat protein